MEQSLRNLYLLLSGESIELFDRNLETIITHNVDFGASNSFRYIEDAILSKMNKKLDIIHISDQEIFKEEQDNLSEHKAIKVINHQIAINFHLTKGFLVSSLGYGLPPLMCFLISLMKLGYPRIYIFGIDELEDKEIAFINDCFWKVIDYLNIKKNDIISVGVHSKITGFDKVSIFDIL